MPLQHGLSSIKKNQTTCRLSRIGLRIIGGYDRYTRTDKMRLDHKIPMLKSYIKCLSLKMYASAKRSRNRYVKKLGTVSMVIDPRVPRPIHILR
jgi:hypothetical protein